MIRPAILTFLRKGKMICQKVYPTLIDTWNYVVSRVDNIKGDQDVNAAEGWITVDSTKPTHPVIRFDSSKLPEALSNDVLVDSQVSSLSLSSIDKTDDGVLTLHNFKDNETDWQFDLSTLVDKKNEYQFLMRHSSSDGLELQYASLSSFDLSQMISSEISSIISAEISNIVSSAVDETINNTLSVYTDSGKIDVVDNETSSMQTQVIDGKTKLELYNFHSLTPNKKMALSTLIDDGTHPQNTDHILVRHYDGDHNTLQYVSLSALGVSADNIISGDSNQERTSFFSIDTHIDKNGNTCYQLHDFDNGCYTQELSGMTEFKDSAGLDYNTFDPAWEFIWRVNGGYPSTTDGCALVYYAHGKLYQRHEALDGDNANVPHSMNWKSGIPKEIQLYNFSSNTTDNSIKKGNVNYTQNDGLVVRKNQQIEYMPFCNLSTFVPRSIADSQVPNTANKSLSSQWNNQEEKDVFELYDWKDGGSSTTIDLHLDGCIYQWPQDTTSPTGQDYFLIKHVENGQTTLQYKELYINQMSVDVQGIEDIEDWIHHTYHDYGPEINYLSGVIDDLSSHGLSGNFWQTGGDSTTNTCQDAHIDSLDADYINCDGCVDFGSVNCDYGVYAGCYVGTGGYLQLGSTSLDESQLQQLLRLI